ncbi:unnamed protein product, partial [Linum tenue]
VWPINKSRLKTRILREVLLKLEVKLNIVDVNEPIIKKFLWKRFGKIVKDKRCNFKQDHDEYANEEEARRHKPPNLEQETWNNLCEYWANPKVKALCVKNKNNRAKVK